MVNSRLDVSRLDKVSPIRTAGEKAYLNSMMPEVRQEGYTCVSGCQDCISCGGNDYRLRQVHP